MTKHTLTTGPFLLPDVLPGGNANNRLVVLIANPTNDTLMAAVSIDELPISIPVIIPAPVATNTGHITPTGFAFGLQAIAPHSFLQLDIPITPATMNALRVTTFGDYAVDDHQPIAGKLEITVNGGFGRTSAPGLAQADPSLFFRYEDFVA